MMNIEDISKQFGDQVLLESTGFQINPGERVGLVGRNGHGKTTLLNMISGRDHPDHGTITCPSGYRMGVLPQECRFSKQRIIDEVMDGLLEHEKDHSWKAEKILAGLGFEQEQLTLNPGVFSGGFQVRLNLAKVLVSDPDLLILDEPTNYLDITSIRWISKFLLSWPREILLVTHDRSFMDSVVTHIAGIHRRKIKKIKGDTSKYYMQIAQDEEVYEKTRLNQEKRTKEIETFISKFRAKARLASMVQSRIKTLEKTEKKEKLEKLKNLEFSFRFVDFPGKQAVKIDDLTFGWDRKHPIIKDLSFSVFPEDRIGVIGKNGKGKTTLLRLLNGNIKPDHGDISFNPGVYSGYFEQTNIQSLNDEFTIVEELLTCSPDSDPQTARNICGAMMFEQEAALKKIASLSGGEKSRVMLAKLLMQPLNLLLLDEPSNHLDMEACDSLVCALDNFKGAVVMVTHNEMFLHSLATRLIVFKGGSIDIFEGSYAEFLKKQGWDEEEKISQTRQKSGGFSRKQARQKRSELITERSRKTGPVKHKIEALESRIDENEHRIKQIHDSLMKASQDGDGERIQALSIQLSQLENKNETLFDQLEIKLDELEQLDKYFEEKMDDLERK